MTLRLALRSLLTRPVRSAVLACGFGFGIGVMAALLGVGQVILEQARAPALEGGGDLRVSGLAGKVTSARFFLSAVLGAPPFDARVAGASPTRAERLYLVRDDGAVRVRARGGIPSLERSIGDPETSAVEAWRDTPADRAWAAPDPADVLRSMDRFHPIPEVPGRAGSWAEWLYFNGHAGDARFYLTFLVGPRAQGRFGGGPPGRGAWVRLQIERGGRSASYAETAEIVDVSRAPDLTIGASSVALEGLRYRIRVDLPRETAPAGGGAAGSRRDRVVGELTLDAVPGRSLPPVQIRGAGGWVSGYVVPVLSGRLGGSLVVDGETLDLDGGTGYHDHNWGFWEGVTWRWGQIAHDDLSVVFGRIHPPADAADPARVPGFAAVLGPEGPLGFSTEVEIAETDAPDGSGVRELAVRARGGGLDLRLRLDVEQTVRTRLDRAPAGTPAREFFQLRGTYEVTGVAGDRRIDFRAPGAAETFR